MKRVWLDVDGVVADFASYTILSAQRMGIIDPSEFPQRYEDVKLWEFGPAFDKVWNAVSKDVLFWSLIPVMPFSRPFTMKVDGYISARPCPVSVTETWLYLNGFPSAEVIHADSHDKAAILLNHGCTHYVDDKPSTVNECLLQNINAYLMDAPYNKDGGPTNWRRLYGLSHFKAMVDNE